MDTGKRSRVSDQHWIDGANTYNANNPIIAVVKELDCNFILNTPCDADGEQLRSTVKYCYRLIPGRMNIGTKRLIGLVGNSYCPPHKLGKIVDLGRNKNHVVLGTSYFNSGVNYATFCFGAEVTALFVSYDDTTKEGSCLLYANVQSMLSEGHPDADEHRSWAISFHLEQSTTGVDTISFTDLADPQGVADPPDGEASEVGSTREAPSGQASSVLNDFFMNSWFMRVGRHGYMSLDLSWAAVEEFILLNVVSVARDDTFPGTKVHAQFFDADLRNEEGTASEPNKQRIILGDNGNLAFTEVHADPHKGIHEVSHLLSMVHQMRYELPCIVGCTEWYKWTPCAPNSKPIIFYSDVTRYVEAHNGVLTDITQLYVSGATPGQKNKEFKKKLALNQALECAPKPDRPANKPHARTFCYKADYETKKAGFHTTEHPEDLEGAWSTITHVSRLNPSLPAIPADTAVQQKVTLRDGTTANLYHTTLEVTIGITLSGCISAWRETDFTNLTANCPSVVVDPEKVLGVAPLNYGVAKYRQVANVHLTSNAVNPNVEDNGRLDLRTGPAKRVRIYGRATIIETGIIIGCRTVDEATRERESVGNLLALQEGPQGQQLFREVMDYDEQVIYQVINEGSSHIRGVHAYRLMYLFAGNETVEALQLGNIAPNYPKNALHAGLTPGMVASIRRDCLVHNWHVVLNECVHFKAALDTLQRARDEWKSGNADEDPVLPMYRMVPKKSSGATMGALEGSDLAAPAPGGAIVHAPTHRGGLIEVANAATGRAGGKRKKATPASAAAKKQKQGVTLAANKAQVPQDTKSVMYQAVSSVITSTAQDIARGDAEEDTFNSASVLNLIALGHHTTVNSNSAHSLCTVAQKYSASKSFAPLIGIYQVILAATAEGPVPAAVANPLLHQILHAMQKAFDAGMGKITAKDEDGEKLEHAIEMKEDVSDILSSLRSAATSAATSASDSSSDAEMPEASGPVEEGVDEEEGEEHDEEAPPPVGAFVPVDDLM